MSKISRDGEKIVEILFHVSEDMKGMDAVYLDLSPHCDFADGFFICSANSPPHLKALSREMESQVFSQYKTKPTYTSGKGNEGWIVLDYIDVVVHLFSSELRDFYGLEDFWGKFKKKNAN